MMMEEQDQIEKLNRKRAYVRCGVNNCHITSTSHPQYSFYSLPKDSERQALWLQRIQRIIETDTPRLHVCERHFEKRYINYDSSRKLLRKAAVPTRYLPKVSGISSPNSGNVSPYFEDEIDGEEASIPDDTSPMDNLDNWIMPVKVEPVEQIDANAATTSSDINETLVNRNLNFIFEYEKPTTIVKIKEENDCLTVFVDEDNEDKYHDENLIVNESEDATTFDNFPEVKKKYQKTKYSNQFKMFALDLYFKSPNAYRLLRATFSLPRISTIYRLCIPKTSELSQDVLRALSIKVNGMTPAQKHSVVCIGTMSLSPTIEYDAVNDKIFGLHEFNGVQTLKPARHVLIVIARGLFYRWKQAVAFSFLSNFQNYKDINFFIDEIIRKLLEIGLNVRTLISDLESDLLTAAKERGLSAKDPFFFVGAKKIYFMYDTLHLMRNIRDNFLANNLTFNNCLLAKWHHIVKCYVYDKKNNLLRLAPKLSDDHIKPKARGANDNLKFTAELFSRTTATAISTCIDLKVLEPAAKDTVQWILIMSKLKDMLNFSTEYPPEDKNAVFSGATTQVDFLVEMLSLFFDIRLSNDVIKSGRVSEMSKNKDLTVFKEGFTITINSLLLLYGALKSENCWLPIVGLSHDCLNIFFDNVRQRHGPQPTAQQMVMCINKFPIFNVFQYFSKRRVAGEMEIFLARAKQMPTINMYDEELAESYEDKCAHASSEFPSIALPEENKIEHLALYLLYKGYQMHYNCEAMKKYVCSKDIIDNNKLQVAGFTICGNKINLVSQQFVHFLKVLELKFKEYFIGNPLPRNIAGLQSFTKNVTFEMPCECFPIDFIKQLYFRFRLYRVLKYNNVLFRHDNCKAVFVIYDL